MPGRRGEKKGEKIGERKRKDPPGTMNGVFYVFLFNVTGEGESSRKGRGGTAAHGPAVTCIRRFPLRPTNIDGWGKRVQRKKGGKKKKKKKKKRPGSNQLTHTAGGEEKGERGGESGGPSPKRHGALLESAGPVFLTHRGKRREERGGKGKGASSQPRRDDFVVPSGSPPPTPPGGGGGEKKKDQEREKKEGEEGDGENTSFIVPAAPTIEPQKGEGGKRVAKRTAKCDSLIN